MASVAAGEVVRGKYSPAILRLSNARPVSPAFARASPSRAQSGLAESMLLNRVAFVLCRKGYAPR